MALYLFRRFSEVNAKVHGSGVYLNVNSKPVFINLATREKIESIYKTLAEFDDVRVESLDGIRIGKTTYFSELQGTSFYIKVGKTTFKIIQSDMETPIEMHRFLFEHENEGLEKYLFMHQYLSKISKSTPFGKKFRKEELASIIEDACPVGAITSLSSKEIHDRVLNVYGEIQEMKTDFEFLDRKANSFARNILWSGFGITVLQFLYVTSGTYYFYCWDIMEAQAYLITLSNTVFGFGAYVHSRLQPNQLSFYNRIYENILKKKSGESQFDLEKYLKLQAELKYLQAKLTLDSSSKLKSST